MDRITPAYKITSRYRRLYKSTQDTQSANCSLLSQLQLVLVEQCVLQR